jgi:acetyl esterase/lipase
VAFGTHRETGDPLLCDLWQPPDDVPPTGLGIIYLHGSAWHYSDKDVGTRPFFRRLAQQGHLIMDVAYTLAPKAEMRAMVADVIRAIAWLKTEGSEYGVNPERIVLMGGSAGAHLALLAAFAPEHAELKPADVEMDTAVRAVVSYYGPCDLVAQHRRSEEHMGDLGLARCREFLVRSGVVAPHDAGRIVALTDLVANALGASPEEAPALYRLFSPISHVGPHCPPTLLLQGGHDLFRMAPDVRRLHQALCDAGVPSVYVEFPETEHAFDLLFPCSPAAQAATCDTERFLALMV